MLKGFGGLKTYLQDREIIVSNITKKHNEHNQKLIKIVVGE